MSTQPDHRASFSDQAKQGSVGDSSRTRKDSIRFHSKSATARRSRRSILRYARFSEGKMCMASLDRAQTITPTGGKSCLRWDFTEIVVQGMMRRLRLRDDERRFGLGSERRKKGISDWLNGLGGGNDNKGPKGLTRQRRPEGTVTRADEAKSGAKKPTLPRR